MSRETAFSNGTQSYDWMANWCDRCLRDAIFRNTGKGPGCPIIAGVLLTNKVPPEWIEQDAVYADYHCIEFRAPGSGSPDPKPKPRPQPGPGLFPEPERGVRKLASLPEPQTVGTP